MTARLLFSPTLAFALTAALIATGSGQAQDKKDEKKVEKKDEKKQPGSANHADRGERLVRQARAQRARLLAGQVRQADAARLLHPRRRLAERRQEQLLRRREDVPRQRHLGRHHQLPAHDPGERAEGEPPVKAPLEDAARALQFVRSKAAEWNIDKKRIGATGGSAGGCSSLWLAFHDDMADPKSDDPVARESTRLYCAAVNGAQVSLDPKEVREWMPNYTYGAHAFGLKNLDEVEKQREKLADWIKEYSPIEHVTKDDPPIGLYYGGVKGAKVGESHPDPTHSPILGVKLAEKLKAAGVEVVFHSNTEPNEQVPDHAGVPDRPTEEVSRPRRVTAVSLLRGNS